MFDALVRSFKKVNDADYEYVHMLAAAQATQQGLDPVDLDNDQGTDALAAIYDVLLFQPQLADRDVIYVTPAWRRVVISARRLRMPTPMPERQRYWSYDRETQTATRGEAMLIPTL